jgi:hypothetical protein
MSSEIAFSIPAALAANVAPTTPAAGPETSAHDGCAAASSSVATPPEERITNGSRSPAEAQAASSARR